MDKSPTATGGKNQVCIYQGMHSAFPNICERMLCSKELSEFKHGILIGCHSCNKISFLLDIPQSTVNFAKWKHLETTASQPVLRHMVHEIHQ